MAMLISVLPVNAGAASGGKLVALTFDDGPGKYTEELLDGLEARGVTATFFMLGSLAEEYPELLERMAKNGHQLASHTYSHSQLTKLSMSQLKKEISDTNNVLALAGGEQTYYIRPPYGFYNTAVKKAANAPIILWSVDPLDWKYRNTATVTNNILKTVKDGDIILLHDIHETSVKAALNVIDRLQPEGYEFVTVSELLRRRGVEAENGGVYSCARNNGINLGPMNDKDTLENHWGYNAIRYALDNGLVDKFVDDSFRPDYNMSRGAFAAALGRLWVKNGGSLSSEYDEVFKFSDVSSSDKYYEYVQWASNAKIMTGYGDGRFGYYAALTREQMAICVVRYLEYTGREISESTIDLTYKDASSIAGWALSGVRYCTEIGLLKGTDTGNFRPKAYMTRVQAVTVIKRIDELVQTESSAAELQQSGERPVLPSGVRYDSGEVEPEPPAENKDSVQRMITVLEGTLLLSIRLIYNTYVSLSSIWTRK